MTVKLVTLIYADNELAGNGKDHAHPYRNLQQLFDLDGQLICQYDPIYHDSSLPPDHASGGSFFANEPRKSVQDSK